jgi:hypothetical protein
LAQSIWLFSGQYVRITARKFSETSGILFYEGGLIMIRKKILTVLLTGALSMSALAAPASAAVTSYQEAEKAELATYLDSYPDRYEAKMELSEEAMKGSYADILLTVGEAGRAMLGTFVPMDVSWLDTVYIGTDASIQDGVEAVTMTLKVNDTDICHYNFQMDMSTMDMVMEIPELAPGYLVGNYNQILDAATEGDDLIEEMPVNPEQMILISKIAMAIMENPPAAETITAIMERYATMLIEAFEDGAATQEVLTVGEISEDTVTAEGKLTADAGVTALKDIFAALKDDAEIKELIDSFSSGVGDPAELYAEFQGALDELIDEMEPADEEDEVLVSRIWANADDHVIGRQIGTEEDGVLTPLFTYQTATDGEEAALEAVCGENNDFVLNGTGTVTDGKLNGDYQLFMDDEPMVSVQVIDYDTEAVKDGHLDATYILKLTSDDPDMGAFFDAYALTADIDMADEGGYMGLDLSASGSSLASLSLTTGLGEGVEILDSSALTDTYDIMDEEAMVTYMSSFDPTEIFSNLAAAGMPDSFLETVMMMMGGFEEEE